MARTYTDEERKQALDLYMEHGAVEASRRCGINSGTIASWASRSGAATERTQNAEVARAARQIHRGLLREDLRGLLLEKALDMLGRMDQEHIDFRGKDANQVTYERAPADACKAYATAAAILLDKFRLEMGETTARTETVTVSEVDVELARLTARLVDAPAD